MTNSSAKLGWTHGPTGKGPMWTLGYAYKMRNNTTRTEGNSSPSFSRGHPDATVFCLRSHCSWHGSGWELELHLFHVAPVPDEVTLSGTGPSQDALLMDKSHVGSEANVGALFSTEGSHDLTKSSNLIPYSAENGIFS